MTTPVSIVLTRDRDSGRIHRRARIEGIPGYLTYEADNADQAGAFDVIPDLSAVRSEGEFCERCFGPLDNPDAAVTVPDLGDVQLKPGASPDTTERTGNADAVTSAEAATEEYS